MLDCEIMGCRVVSLRHEETGGSCPSLLQESRYSAQTEVFGPALQAKLRSVRVFLVGAGALGCEFLKNFAMMGLASSPEGQVRMATLEAPSLLSAMCILGGSDLANAFVLRRADLARCCCRSQ